MKLIVNADDYALDLSTSQAILSAFANGWISSTTCMANMPDFDICMRKAAEAGVLDRMGVHLNLTQGSPLTDDIRKNKRFCNSDGVFHGHIARMSYLNRRSRTDVQTELQAQIDRLRSYGVAITHADSHHHIHTAPWIYLCVRQVLRRSGVSAVRISNTCSVSSVPKKLYKRWFCWQLRHDGFRTTDAFGNYRDLPLICIQSVGTAELETHPVMTDGRVRNKVGTGYDDFQNGILLHPYHLDEEKETQT